MSVPSSASVTICQIVCEHGDVSESGCKHMLVCIQIVCGDVNRHEYACEYIQ